MGKYAKKTPYKKHLKQEKAKVKLKVAHKTILPKGQNITKTDFKVKKLVLKDQLKLHDEHEIVSKKNLNIQELLARLKHHNTTVRSSAVNGLSEILSAYGISQCINHLPSLLDAAARLCLDVDVDVRSGTRKLLTLILSQVTEDQLSPLFEIIVKYLACGMSHINADIRESSLNILDVLITKCPRLIAVHCKSVILPAFLDLISIKFNSSDRKLNLHYNNRMTTNLWRVKVLCRLHSLLQAVVENYHDSSDFNSDETVREIQYKNSEYLYASLYSDQYRSSIAPDVRGVEIAVNSSDNSTTEIQRYVNLLIPLLLDIFVEASPSSTLSPEAAVLLRYVTNIILLLWNIFSYSDNSQQLKYWFSEKFAKTIIEKLVDKKFPYTVGQCNDEDQTVTDNKKRRNKPKKMGTYLKKLSKLDNAFEIADINCIEENINLCHIYTLLFKDVSNSNVRSKVTHYFSSTLKMCNTLSKSVTEKLMLCTDTLFSSPDECQRAFNLNYLITLLVAIYKQAATLGNDFITDRTFTHLSNIVLKNREAAFHSNPELQCWIDDLPKLLTADSISYDKVACIANIARCNIPAFTNSLDGYIEEILDNLPLLKILTNSETKETDGKRMISNMLYFVQTWDAEFVRNLQKAIKSGYFQFLTSHINGILRYKL